MSNVLPGSEGMIERRVLARLDAAGRVGVEEDALREEMGAEAGALDRALRRLLLEGRAVDIERRWLAPHHTPWTAGMIELMDSGDAVLRTLDGEKKIFFVRRGNRKAARDGDRVLVRRTAKKDQPWDDRLPEAAVVRILGKRYDALVGTLEVDEQGRRWLAPFDLKQTLELLVEGGDQVPAGHYVVVEVDLTPGCVPVGRVIEVLGDPAMPGVDVLVLLRHHGIPEEFPLEVLQAASAFPADPRPADWAGREDLRGQVVVTIDGETARDFDDAISIDRLPDGVFRLGVHIADVAHAVEEGSALDLEAYRRGTSVYYPERAIPMLPEELSNGLCSLRPDVPRLTVSVFLEIDRDGQIRSTRFAETVIQSTRRLTYTEVRRVLEEPREEDAAGYGPVLPALREMHHLMQILNHARTVRGSIDFDLPEGDVVLDTDGHMVGVLPEERNVAHRIVEEFMIAANEAVALELVTREMPALYRIHAMPTPERLEELREVLAHFGYALPEETENLPPAVLQEILRDVQGKPEEHFVSSLVLRTMRRALYDPECQGHYALASPYYTHFTSPIRRYPDLIVHRSLKALLHGTARERVENTLLAERMPVMADHTSDTERRAEQSERDLLQWKKVRFLADRKGETFTGRITNVQRFGFFVELDGYYVSGMVPVHTLGNDYFRYEPQTHQLIGERWGRTFRLADPVEVVLVDASVRLRRLDLRMADVPEPAVRTESPGRREREPKTARRPSDRRSKAGGRRSTGGKPRAGRGGG